jgi:hypothetical protein
LWDRREEAAVFMFTAGEERSDNGEVILSTTGTMAANRNKLTKERDLSHVGEWTGGYQWCQD